VISASVSLSGYVVMYEMWPRNLSGEGQGQKAVTCETVNCFTCDSSVGMA